MPCFSMIAASDPNLVSARAWVPLDDNYNLQIMMRGRLDRLVTEQERGQVRDPFAAWADTSSRPAIPRRGITRRRTFTTITWSTTGSRKASS